MVFSDIHGVAKGKSVILKASSLRTLRVFMGKQS